MRDERTAQAIRGMSRLLDAVVETIHAAGPAGIPSGHIYAGLTSHGCTLDQWEAMETALVMVGRIRKRGDVLTAA